MTLLQNCQNNKVAAVTALKFAQDCLDGLGVVLEMPPLSKICQCAGINRTQVYESLQQFKENLHEVEVAGPGRPAGRPAYDTTSPEAQGWRLREQVWRFRLDHPGAAVLHTGGHTTYSEGFMRFILDLYDTWACSIEWFCEQAEVPYQTLRSWRKKDLDQPYREHQPRPYPANMDGANDTVRRIVDDYSVWQGSLRDFLKYEAARVHLAPGAIRRVLVILVMLAMRPGKGPRYRGATEKCLPGSILVTDGKTVTVVCTGSGEIHEYNWQGIIDQATVCHTAVVVTETECAAGVGKAFEESCKFLGRPPLALLHDNKPCHDDLELRKKIEKTTKMIPATLGRGENKAGIEGEFGKFEQAVGTIHLDDSSMDRLKMTAVSEIVRGYTAGLNHAGRFEFDGASRESMLRNSCPDPEKDRQFIDRLHADHTKKRRIDVLPTKAISRAVLDVEFERFGITGLDPKGEIREWLSGRFTPEAIRLGLAKFATEWEKRRLRNKTAHRYLVKLIQNFQHEVDLRRQEELLREYAAMEQSAWSKVLEGEYATLVAECNADSPEKDLAFRLAEGAVFGCLILQRAFMEEKLKELLQRESNRFAAVCSHIRRLFEAPWENRFALIGKLVAWEYQLAA